MDFLPSIDLTLPKQSHNNSHLTPISLIQRFKFPEVSINKTIKLKHNLTVHAINDDNNLSDSGFIVFKNESHDDIDALKKQLVNSFNGTNRGLSVNSETRAKIVELITQLEAENPTPAPTEALTLLDGKWILAYTSFAGIFPLLSRAGSLSPVKLDEISQTIDSNHFTVENTLIFSGPMSTTTSISTNSKYEVRSPKLVQIKFQEGVIGTPQLTDSVELPENLELLGQHIDLSPLQGVLNSVQEAASSMAKSISSRGPFKFSIPKSNPESWLLTTYLDKDIRISRGDGGSVFVLIKAGSPLLST